MAISIAPASRRSRRSWSSKQYILAALAGTLAVIAVVSVVSVLLCPAHVYFSLTDATYSSRKNLDRHLNVSIMANNTSRLTKVHYVAIQVEVWVSKTAWFPAAVDTSAYPSWQQPRNTTEYRASGKIALDEKADLQESQKNSNGGGGGGGDEDDDRYPEVVIKAKVWFRYGLAGTRLYNIAVSCPSVHFTKENNTSNGTNHLQVNCTA